VNTFLDDVGESLPDLHLHRPFDRLAGHRAIHGQIELVFPTQPRPKISANPPRRATACRPESTASRLTHFSFTLQFITRDMVPRRHNGT
jgi:hypothetical protein